MNWSTAWFIGLRYVTLRQRSHMVSFISFVSMLGLTLGVALLIVVLSVMNGFDREMRQRILGLVPHATINSYQAMESWRAIIDIAERKPGVIAAAPFIHIQGMLLKSDRVEASLIYGVDPARESKVSVLGRYLGDDGGGLQRLAALQPGDMIVGRELAQLLGLSVGDRLTMIMPQSADNLAGVRPVARQFQVAAIFSSGTEIDRRLALIHIAAAAELLGLGDAVQGVRITVKDLFRAPDIARAIVADLPLGYFARDWTRSHGNLFSAIQLSKRLVVLLLCIIIAVAAFNVVSTLILVVSDKRADIAILRTLGLAPRGVMAVFMVQGTVIGLLGTLLGVLIGVVLSLSVSELVDGLEALLGVQFLQSDVYPVSYLPSDLRWHDTLLVGGTAVVMCFLATIVPSLRAARVQPADALRHDV